jgi:hypothetical protein
MLNGFMGPVNNKFIEKNNNDFGYLAVPTFLKPAEACFVLFCSCAYPTNTYKYKGTINGA